MDAHNWITKNKIMRSVPLCLLTPLKPVCMRKTGISISVHGCVAVGIGTHAALTASAAG